MTGQRFSAVLDSIPAGDVPPELAKALEADPEAAAAFGALS